MEVHLNIGLKVKGEANSFKACSVRAYKAIGILQFHYPQIQWVREQVEYENNLGVIELEDTLIARLEDVVIQSIYLEYVLHSICRVINQECVAYYWPSKERGRLVGPKANAWGEFDLDYFTLYEEAAA